MTKSILSQIVSFVAYITTQLLLRIRVWRGVPSIWVAGALMEKGSSVYIEETGSAGLASCDEKRSGCVGVALNRAEKGGLVEVRHSGIAAARLRGAPTNRAAGEVVFLSSEPGVFSCDAPTDSGLAVVECGRILPKRGRRDFEILFVPMGATVII